MELWLQVKSKDEIFLYPNLPHLITPQWLLLVLAPLVYLDWFERPVIEMVCNGSSLLNDENKSV